MVRSIDSHIGHIEKERQFRLKISYLSPSSRASSQHLSQNPKNKFDLEGIKQKRLATMATAKNCANAVR